jgi:hypothetical protein
MTTALTAMDGGGGGDYSIYQHTLFIIIIWTLLNYAKHVYDTFSKEDTLKCLTQIKLPYLDTEKASVNASFDFKDEPLMEDTSPSNEDDTTSSTTTTTTTTEHEWNFRKWLYQYHSHLDGGKGSRVEQWMWKHYEEFVPYRYRNINTETGLTYPLPEWFEETIDYVARFNYYRLLLFIIAYILIMYAHQPMIQGVNQVTTAISSFSWSSGGGGTDLSVHDSIKDYVTYNDIVDKFLYTCLSFDTLLSSLSDNITFEAWQQQYSNIPMDTYCSVPETSLWIPPRPPFEHYYNIAPHEKDAISTVFINENHDMHHIFHTLPLIQDVAAVTIANPMDSVVVGERKKGLESKKKSKKVLVREKTLLDYLQSLDDMGNMCICPLLIGLHTVNMTFLYKRNVQQWSILYNPFIYRNNTHSEFIESSPIYDEKRELYKNSKRLQSDAGSGESSTHWSIINVEHTSFYVEDEVVEESSSSSSSSVGDNVVRMTRVLNTHYDDHGISVNKRNVILYAPSERRLTTKQERITLSNDDAICFIYCTSHNKQG